jgi:putative adhesin
MSKAFAGLTVLFWIASFSAGAEVRNLDRTVALDPLGTVSFQTFKGSIEVETWGEPRAEIHARIEPDTTCGNEADQAERVRLTEIEVDSSADRLSLRSNYDRLEHLSSIPFHVDGFDSTCNAYPFVRYRLRIPATAALEIEDHKSKISVSGLNAGARIRTHKGVVNVTGQEGALDLLTHKGKVHVEFARLAGGSRLETYKGDIEVAVPRAAGFDLDARVARSGTLEAPFPLDEQQVSRHERVYDQKVNGGGSRLELTTRKGSLRITEK